MPISVPMPDRSAIMSAELMGRYYQQPAGVLPATSTICQPRQNLFQRVQSTRENQAGRRVNMALAKPETSGAYREFIRPKPDKFKLTDTDQ